MPWNRLFRDTSGVTEPLGALVAAGGYERLSAVVADLEDPGELGVLLCSVPGREEYLGTDLALVRLLEDVLDVLSADDACRARLEARLALELRGDPTSVERRLALLASATELAERQGDPAALVDVLLARVHAVWEPEGSDQWVEATDRAIAVARRERLLEQELYARRTRVEVLLGLGLMVEAEVELGRLARLAPREDPGWQTFVSSRSFTVEVVRGGFEDAARAADDAEASAIAAELPDGPMLMATLRGNLARERGDLQGLRDAVGPLVEATRRLPGHHFEAPLARTLFELGRTEEARVALARAVASLQARRGTTWLLSLYDAGVVAAAIGAEEQRAWLLSALRDCGADWACLTVWLGGSTHVVAGMLATGLESWEEALVHLDRGVADLDGIGALPMAARARRVRARVHAALGNGKRAEADEERADATFRDLGMGELPLTDGDVATHWVLEQVADGWHLVAGAEEAHLRPSRGLDHLHTLLANPGKDVPALLLESGGEVDTASTGIDVLDEEATRSYRARIREIDEALDAADQRGDQEGASALQAEREALAAELRRALGLGGRSRTTSDAAQRARVNVTRNLRRAIEQIGLAAPLAAVHLGSSVKTGTTCRYEPAHGGPDAWRTS